MEIIKYTKSGRDYEHDIHFTHGGNVLRFGSNDDARPELGRYFRALCTYAASEVAGMNGIIIKRVEWKREHKDRSKLIKVSGYTSSTDGRDIKVELPEFGMKIGFVEDPATGNLEEQTIPLYCDMTAVELIEKFEAELAYYAQNGAGQMEFDFQQEEVSKEINSMFESERRTREKVTAFPGR